MDSIVSLPKQIVDWLSSQEDMNDLTFFVEYPPINKAVPLRKAIIAVGIENIDITDKFESNDDGVLERQEYCRLALIKANLSICVPFSQGGQTCHDIFTRITDALTFRTNLNIAESGCTQIESDRDTDALVMNCWMTINADFCPAVSTGENFASFLNKDMLCGSHINNKDIHVTTSDKEKWNTPIITGFYLGDGSSSKTISMDFSPTLVIVAAGDYPPVSVDFSNSSAKAFAAIGNSSINSQGITLLSKGFKVAYSTKTTLGVSTALNQSGIRYLYAVFK